MPDIIRLLPDKIANRIAAGEVVQRPASVVKELLENAIDAGAKRIQLVIKNAGKSLIQITDDGKGMTETDARMSFERHATSKIKKPDDLFAITTMGFRGEALASIASISKVEMKTKTRDMAMGTQIIVEGSSLISMEPCACLDGTMIAVKSLFFNTPARRKFLKSDPVELRHINDAFLHVALAHHEVFFSMTHNDNEIFHLPVASRKQRIVHTLGKQWNDKLVTLEEETDIVKFSGFIAKPEAAKRRRGEQFFFVNDRFIKSPYLNHAVKSAFEGLVSKEQFPGYVIFMEMEPRSVDVNVHPSKHEVKFEEERILYNYLQVAVKHALGVSQVLPSLDFERESLGGFDRNSHRSEIPVEEQQRRNNNRQEWRELYRTESNQEVKAPFSHNEQGQSSTSLFQQRSSHDFIQYKGRYMVLSTEEGVLLVDVLASRQKLIYDRFLQSLENEQAIAKQRELFPVQIELSVADAQILPELLDTVNALGFELSHFGGNSFVNHAIPALSSIKIDLEQTVNALIDDFKSNRPKKTDRKKFIAESLTKCMTLSYKYSKDEMREIFEKLLDAQAPFYSPNGKNCMIVLNEDEIRALF